MTAADNSIMRINQFPVACERINALMPALLAELKQQDLLRKKLFQVEFLAATTGDTIITLIYHRQLDEAWETLALEVQKKLGCSIIGRSRGKKIVLGCDYVTENFTVDGENFSQRQPERPRNITLIQYLNQISASLEQRFVLSVLKSECLKPL